MIIRTAGTAWRHSSRLLHTSRRVLAEVLRDEQIKARYARVVDAETGSISQDAKHVHRILKNMDRTKYWLVQVKAGMLDRESEAIEESSGKGKNSVWQQPRPDQKRQEERRREQLESSMDLEDLAIVKYVDKKDAYSKERERRLEKKSGQKSNAGSSASGHKEADMTWSSTSHDIEHKLKKLQTHLKKKGPGARGTITVKAKAAKGREGGLPLQGKKELVQRIIDYLCDWTPEELEEMASTSGSRYHARLAREVEWKNENTTAVLYFEVVKGLKPSKV